VKRSGPDLKDVEYISSLARYVECDMNRAMKTSKRRRLEAQGWRFGSAKDFLGLTDEEAEYIELRLSLAALLRKRRENIGYTQTQVADLIGSSQSRVAKMEAGDPSVSVDLLIRTLLALGVNRKQVGRAIGAAASA
jgi:DNA-binding XRE family transcriptional regulator